MRVYRSMRSSSGVPKLVIGAAILIAVLLYIRSRQYTASTAGLGANSGGEYQSRGGVLYPKQGKKHVLVTGGAGFIGSHATLRLLEEGHAVTTIDNLSRGNPGAIKTLQKIAQEKNMLDRYQFVEADLGVKEDVCATLKNSKIDLVMHFAAVAYVGESVAEPLRYYHNITANTVTILECMKENEIKELVYSSTCATYGNVDEENLPITEATPPVPINPYGKAKLMAENAIRDYAFSDDKFHAIIFRYFNVYGSDPDGRLGEFPRPELRRHGRISGACMDAALGVIEELTIMGTKHPTKDGTCVRDYIHVTDLVDAHVKGMEHLQNPPNLYNIGTGNGVSVKEFVDACKKVTQKDIKVYMQEEARPGDYAEVYSDVTKIQKEMGWKAKYDNVEEGLQHAWTWRSKNPNGYRA